jgi:hypothetical protein
MRAAPPVRFPEEPMPQPRDPEITRGLSTINLHRPRLRGNDFHSYQTKKASMVSRIGQEHNSLLSVGD